MMSAEIYRIIQTCGLFVSNVLNNAVQCTCTYLPVLGEIIYNVLYFALYTVYIIYYLLYIVYCVINYAVQISYYILCVALQLVFVCALLLVHVLYCVLCFIFHTAGHLHQLLRDITLFFCHILQLLLEFFYRLVLLFLDSSLVAVFSESAKDVLRAALEISREHPMISVLVTVIIIVVVLLIAYWGKLIQNLTPFRMIAEAFARTPTDAGRNIDKLCTEKNGPEKRLEELQEEQRCAICLDKLRNIACLPCGHVTMCENCSELVTTNSHYDNRCIVCRRQVGDLVKVFL